MTKPKANTPTKEQAFTAVRKTPAGSMHVAARGQKAVTPKGVKVQRAVSPKGRFDVDPATVGEFGSLKPGQYPDDVQARPFVQAAMKGKP